MIYLSLKIKSIEHESPHQQISRRSVGLRLWRHIKKGAVDEQGTLKHISLTERQNIGQQTVLKLMPGEIREVRHNNFDLNSMVDKYKLKEYGDLWPWELLVRVNVVTNGNRQVLEHQARWPLKPNLIW